MDSEQKNLIADGFCVSYREQYFPKEKQNPQLYEHKEFDYYFNNYGFRSVNEENYNLDDKNDIWCFGCSVTLGVGVSRHDMWPSLIQTHTNRKVKNFAVGGAGPVTTLRLLRHWYTMSEFKPKQIFILGFFPGRNEVWDDKKNKFQFIHHCSDVEDVYEKCIQEMKSTNSVKIIDVETSLESAKKINLKDWGRDGCDSWAAKHIVGHPGVKYHNYIYQKITNEEL